jgi:hypothetical protein
VLPECEKLYRHYKLDIGVDGRFKSGLRYNPYLVASILPFSALMAHLINAVSWPISANSTLYELALFLIIINMTFHFGSLVLYRAPALSVTEGE